ncbi:hemerythrin domain-containing protein [Streptomyces glomeratus]|uniref:Hemerythrin domain-containing protein n=1 Tax=Streptomyces glomeratus TaxID=284452 RepID=A0ABP6LV38_9ACTN|nr:hemerythrin domain-containing protein [Streptomyces glomeratus]MCF1510147.1 hemerythrin domain-containing protein [Streptomyces glomeratus]
MSDATMEREQAARLPEGDVVRILLLQHARIRDLFAEVKSAQGEQKKSIFDELRALLAVHETAEEMILRPTAKKTAGQAEADARNHEEKAANKVLAQLEKMDVSSPEFDDRLAAFERSVIAHAEHEEQEEFPAVRQGCDEDQLKRMGAQLQMVEKMAPTHPHPTAAGSPAAQWITGPFASLVDRVKDAVTRSRGGT